jgi:hypothetical protein
MNILALKNDNSNEIAQQLRDAEPKTHDLREQLQAAADVLAPIEARAPEGGGVTSGEVLLDLVPREGPPRGQGAGAA